MSRSRAGWERTGIETAINKYIKVQLQLEQQLASQWTAAADTKIQKRVIWDTKSIFELVHELWLWCRRWVRYSMENSNLFSYLYTQMEHNIYSSCCHWCWDCVWGGLSQRKCMDTHWRRRRQADNTEYAYAMLNSAKACCGSCCNAPRTKQHALVAGLTGNWPTCYLSLDDDIIPFQPVAMFMLIMMIKKCRNDLQSKILIDWYYIRLRGLTV